MPSSPRAFRIREKMIQLLFAVVVAEAAATTALLFKTPLRKLVVYGLDRLKRGHGPVMVETVAATAVVILASSLYSMVKIHARSGELGAATPTDQVLMARHLLEASLLGYSLFLALIIDRLHHYTRELRSLQANIEALTKFSSASEQVRTGSS
ncbi:hypothetical protein Cni_G21211 [Canna indica]|uniref:Endoplasmic reticulum transmembrane protein n=1 Tax=Canna indica TaxID=4628 RepID=A0AAQ3KPI0_9LILI|nr:hypothetical protein Cni_G21211 [Canna indica]